LKDNKKIIILVQSPFTKWDEKRIGIKEILEHGFDLEIWNVGMISNAKAFILRENISYRSDHEIRFNSLDELKNRLSENRHAFIICLIPYIYSNYFILRLITKNNLYAINRDFSGISGSFQALNIKERIVQKIKLFSLRRILEKLFLLTPIKMLGIKPCSLVFAGGNRSLLRHPLISTKSKVVHIHANDYDIFLKDNKESKPELNYRYAVFIDQNLAHNTDPLITGTGRVVTEQNYFPSLKKFFDQIEKKYDIRVVIAAHPRASQDNASNFYGDRDIFYGNTLPLVRESEIVLLHYSNAVNFAVLYKKPILFFTTKELDSSFRKPAIDSLAASLNKSIYNIDSQDSFDLAFEMEVNHEIYRDFKENYIKMDGTPEVFFWEVVAKSVDKLICKAK
tara:strand:+ start:859 stop:2040 length:1182 start_codon:yes stop_codon:yes gene_type:complete